MAVDQTWSSPHYCCFDSEDDPFSGSSGSIGSNAMNMTNTHSISWRCSCCSHLVSAWHVAEGRNQQMAQIADVSLVCRNKTKGLVSIGSMYAIYGNIYHQYTPVMLAYIPAPWILWGMAKSQHHRPSLFWHGGIIPREHVGKTRNMNQYGPSKYP